MYYKVAYTSITTLYPTMLIPILVTAVLLHLADGHHGGRRLLTHAFIYAACSPAKFPPDSPYAVTLNSLFSSLAAASSHSLYAPFSLPNDTVSQAYGLYQCRADMSPADCADCVASSIGSAELLCPLAYGASLQLDGCLLRYDRQDFIGRMDPSLKYRRCSAAAGGGAEFVRRRDELLNGLLRAAGGFRVSAAGDIEGYAECLGDLEAADCAECLAEAVAKEAALCKTAAAGDVFLAQCYVRYWEAGYFPGSSSEEADEVGKTVAIIVGVVAALALLIVLLSLCTQYLHG